jgi:hypothetical protein
MAHRTPLKYVFYIAATPEKVWEGFVSRESNRIIFSGAELPADLSLVACSHRWAREDRDLRSREGPAV